MSEKPSEAVLVTARKRAGRATVRHRAVIPRNGACRLRRHARTCRATTRRPGSPSGTGQPSHGVERAAYGGTPGLREGKKNKPDKRNQARKKKNNLIIPANTPSNAGSFFFRTVFHFGTHSRKKKVLSFRLPRFALRRRGLPRTTPDLTQVSRNPSSPKSPGIRPQRREASRPPECSSFSHPLDRMVAPVQPISQPTLSPVGDRETGKGVRPP